MAKTVNRYPLTNGVNYKKLNTNYFLHSQFKGKQDNKNDVLTDPNTFADCKNIYIDTDENLVSRAPIKLMGDKYYLVNEFNVDGYNCKVYSYYCNKNDTNLTPLDYFDINSDNLKLISIVLIDKCPQIIYTESDIITSSYFHQLKLDIKITSIKNYLIIWLGGIASFIFDTIANTLSDIKDYIYKPITKLIVNNIEQTLEDNNFLTTVTITRFLYSNDSDINVSLLNSKKVNVYIDNGTLNHIYDLNYNNFEKRYLVAPIYLFDDIIVIDFVINERNSILLFSHRRKTYIAINFSKIIGIPNRPYPFLSSYMFLSRDGLNVCLMHYDYNRKGTNKGYLYYLDITKTDNFDWVLLKSINIYSVGEADMSYSIPCAIVKDLNNYALYYCESTNTNNNTYTMREDVTCVYKDDKSYTSTNFFNIPKENLIYNSFYDCEFFYNRSRKIDNTTVYVAYASIKHQMVKADTYSETRPEELGYTVRGEFVNENGSKFAQFYFGEPINNTPSTFVRINTLLTDRMPVTFSVAFKRSKINIFVPWQDGSTGIVSYAIFIDGRVSYNVKYKETDLYFDVSNLYNNTKTYCLTWNYNGNISIPVDNAAYSVVNYQNLKISETGRVTELEVICFNEVKRFSKPSGNITTFFIAGLNLDRDYIPIYIDNKTSILYKSNYIYTSSFTDNIKMYLDIEEGSGYNLRIPDYDAVIDKTYYAYNNFVIPNEDKYDLDKQKENIDKFLLYFPTNNKQNFLSSITNLHRISDSIIGIFTENDIWYISSTTENGKTLYYAAVKTKLPAGLRYGDDIVTMQNGQALLFPTVRGIAVLQPQDFVATTDMQLQYLTDSIQSTYEKFFEDKNAIELLSDGLPTPSVKELQLGIKIRVYKYWIIFYKHMSTQSLWFDTRNNSWWPIEVKYPIQDIVCNDRVKFICRISTFSVTEIFGNDAYFAPLEGCEFLYCNKEMNIEYTSELPDILLNNMSYDDTLVGFYNNRTYYPATNNNIERISNKVYKMGIPKKDIDWYLVSQKMNFGQPVNYKKILAMYMTNKGDDSVSVELSTKAYRDMYHPEKTFVMQERINDIRTFVKRMNVMHVTDFQYEIKQDKTADIQKQFRLNSLSIKYEIKEVIR